MCTKEEGEGKCKPSEPTPTEPNALADIKKTKCTPCPDEDLPVWTMWSEWAFAKGEKHCGSGKSLRERERTCHDEKKTGRKCKGGDDGKIHKETQEFEVKTCPTVGHTGDDGARDYPEDNENVEDDEVQGDDGGTGGVEDDEATEDEVVELDDQVEDEVVTENSGPDDGENDGGDEDAIDDMDPDTDDVGEGRDDEDGGNGQDSKNEGDDNDGGDGGAGDDGGDYNFHGAHDDEDEEDYGNGGDGDEYPENDEQDSFDFGE